MILDVNSKELCLLSLITWQGPLPLFQGVQGILPDGVKNSVKWKSKIGMKTNTYNFQEKEFNIQDISELLKRELLSRQTT